jgi:hypothetical protein
MMKTCNCIGLDCIGLLARVFVGCPRSQALDIFRSWRCFLRSFQTCDNLPHTSRRYCSSRQRLFCERETVRHLDVTVGCVTQRCYLSLAACSKCTFTWSKNAWSKRKTLTFLHRLQVGNTMASRIRSRAEVCQVTWTQICVYDAKKRVQDRLLKTFLSHNSAFWGLVLLQL